MTQANLSDAKDQFGNWVNLLKTKQQDEIILTEDGQPTIKMTFVEPPKNCAGKRHFGIGKGQFTFDDKLFDEPNEEICKDLEEKPTKRQLGIGKNEVTLPANFDELFDSWDKDVAEMFYGENV